jgi:hypothetical protein
VVLELPPKEDEAKATVPKLGNGASAPPKEDEAEATVP